MVARLLFASILLIGLAVIPAQASPPHPQNTVYVRDYAVGDCSVDDTAAVQTAINAWITQQAAKQAGVLDFGAGCYLVNKQGGTALSVAKSGGFVGGEIRGDGPDLTTIRVTAGTARGMELDDFVNARMFGIGFDGGSSNRTGRGLVMAARHRDLGTCCSTIENVKAQGFNRCFEFGDDAAPGGAAAELVMLNTTALYCSYGNFFTGFNTIDIVFIKPGVLFSTYGFFNNGAQNISIQGGSATGNWTDYYNVGVVGAFSIDGFRSEGRSNPAIPAVKIGGDGQRMTISHSEFDVTSTPAPISIDIQAPGASVILEGNFLNGAVRSVRTTAIMARGNIIRADNAKPFLLVPGVWLDSEANVIPAQPTWWGNGFGGYWPFVRAFQ